LISDVAVMTAIVKMKFGGASHNSSAKPWML